MGPDGEKVRLKSKIQRGFAFVFMEGDVLAKIRGKLEVTVCVSVFLGYQATFGKSILL